MKNQIEEVKEFAIAMSKELTDKLGIKVKNSLIRETISHYFNYKDWNTFVGIKKKTSKEIKMKNQDISYAFLSGDALSICFDYCKESNVLRISHHSFSFVSTSFYVLNESDIKMLLKIKNVEQIYNKKNIKLNKEKMESDGIILIPNEKICFRSETSEFEFYFSELETNIEFVGFVEFLRKISGQKFKEKLKLESLDNFI